MNPVHIPLPLLRVCLATCGRISIFADCRIAEIRPRHNDKLRAYRTPV